MEAPDKIYIEKSLSYPDKFHRQWYREDVVGNGVEYIRKEALLEWAKETEKSRMRVPIEAYNNEDYQAGFIDGFAKFRGILIEKLESL